MFVKGKKLSVLFAILLILMSSAVVYAEPEEPASPEIKILYVGIDNYNDDGSTSEGTVHKYWKYFTDKSTTTSGVTNYYPTPAGFENIQFDFVLAYGPDWGVSSDLKNIAADDAFKEYDVVVFDMVSFSDSSVEKALENADKAGTALIALRGTDVLPNLFKTDEILDRIVSWDLYQVDPYTDYQPGSNQDSYTLASVFVREVIKYSDKSDGLKNAKPLNILYIGYDLKDGDDAIDNAPLHMGVAHFDTLVQKVGKTVYADAVHFDSASYGVFSTTPVNRSNYSYVDVETNNGNWSVSYFQTNMTEKGLDINNYDILICEGFYLQEMVNEFNEKVFSKLDSDVIIYFEARTHSKKGGNSADGYNLNSAANIDISEISNAKYIDQTFTSARSSPAIFLGTRLIPLLNAKYQTVLYANAGQTYYPSGLLFHPGYSKFYETFDDYKNWYESSYHVSRDANGDPKPYIGIFGFYSVYKPHFAELTSLIEAEGYNVVAGYDPVYDDMVGNFIDSNGKSNVAAFISLKNWAMNYGNQQEGVRQLEELNVPVIKAVGSSGWGETTGYDTNSGIPASTFTWMASSSNVDGMIDFIGYNDENKKWIAERAVAWANLNKTDNIAKEVAIMYYNYPPGKEDIGANYLNVMRSLAGDGAKARVTAGNSSVPIQDPNYDGILRELRDEGYNISFDNLPIVTISGDGYKFDYTVDDESLIMNEENLLNLIYAQGINVGAYAPGVLDTMVRQRIEFINAGGNPDDWWGCELIPVKDYLEWLEHETTPADQLTSFGTPGNGTMDSSLYDELVKTWGIPTVDGSIPGSDSEYEAWGGMIWKDEKGEINPHASGMNYIVIPMVKIGDNIRLMPEPNRALASDKALDSSTYHSGDLPPTHQYVAFYFWLNRGTDDSTGSGETGIYGGDRHWKADAVIHFGTHGTQEWLPGTSVGLFRSHDWGPVLLPNLPNIYPYIIANVGEGLTAEYRGNALIISHMTPPMIKTTLYDELLEMETAIRGYQKQNATGVGDSEILAAYRSIIMKTLFDIGWGDAFSSQFNAYKETIVSEGIKMEDGKTRSNVKSVTGADVQYYLVNNKDIFDAFLDNHLHNFVESVRETSLSYGTHVYGDFNEDQIIPMVWNMWSRQGLEDVFLNTYFKDLKDAGITGIPSTTSVNLDELFGEGNYVESDFKSEYTEDNISRFVEIAFADGTPSADKIRSALQDPSAFNAVNEDYENQVILFLLGPVAYITMSDIAVGSDNSAKAEAVVDAWKKDGIYDEMVEEFFEFYHYSAIADHLKTRDKSEENSKYRASNMQSYIDDSGATQTAYHYLDLDEMEVQMVAFVKHVLDNTNAGYSPSYSVIESGLSNTVGDKSGTGRTWYNEQMVQYVRGNNRVDYVDNLKAVGDSEMNALVNALSGGYISPSPGNDPVLNPYVLPTGRNFIGIDASTYSTPAAWKVGKAMGEQLLADYYSKYNEFPSTVSFQRFGVDFIQDEGTLEACLFYLLGCEPTWNAQGTFTGAVPVTQGDESYEEMFKLTVKNSKGKTVEVYRPRTDVVYNSAGMRDGYGSMLRYIDKAVKAVANLDESLDGNYKDSNGVVNNVKKNVDELVALGIDRDLATARVFAQELGTYEIGTGNLVSASGNLPDPSDPEYEAKLKEIADMYLAKMGYLYTEDNWGQSSEQITKLLTTLLGRTDASIFASAGNLYDSLDNDDVFQYFGVMNMVSSMYDKDGNYIEGYKNWKTPEMYITDTSNIHQYKDGKKIVYTASEYIQKDLAARYLNPEWIQGQMEAGYSGAALMAEFIENLYGWSVISNSELIPSATWDKVFEMYTSDEITEWLSHTSPYAMQSINARMVEAIRTGMWSPDIDGLTEEEIKQALEDQEGKLEQSAVNYIKSVIESGVACCHHTCGNPALDEFVRGMLATISPDLLSDEEKAQYLEIVKKALEEKTPEKSLTESKSSGSGVGMASVVEPNTDPNAGEDDGGEDSMSGQNPGVGLDGTETGTPTDVAGFEMTVSKVASSVRDFIQNPTFSTSSMIAIAFVILVVGAIFYGSRKKNL